MGKNECSPLTNVMSAALTPFFNPGVCPPEHNRCLQREPNGFSGVSWSFHPLTSIETFRIHLQNSRESYARPRSAHKKPNVL